MRVGAQAVSPGVALLVIAAALGYFVDIYDLLIFSVVRKSSLASFGILDANSLSTGLLLYNIQMAGVLVGGFFWGLLGDKRGRLSVLFGSITVYALANAANAFAQNIPQYEMLRFLAGFGLAGELGAGVTLVSEVLPPGKRGYGTMLIAAIGLFGAVVASWVGAHCPWRTAYLIGGIMGAVLLALRLGIHESGVFTKTLNQDVSRGDIRLLLATPERFARYVWCALLGTPAYFVIGILISGAPEIGRALGLAQAPTVAMAVTVSYIALAVGDIACNMLSQVLRSRRKALLAFHLFTLAAVGLYLFVKPTDLFGFYVRCALVGFGTGYWALLVTNAAEQFGTNLRATVTTTVPNLVRGLLIPMTWAWEPLKRGLGLVPSLAVLGTACVAIALVSCLALRETFGRELDFLEGQALP